MNQICIESFFYNKLNWKLIWALKLMRIQSYVNMNKISHLSWINFKLTYIFPCLLYTIPQIVTELWPQRQQTGKSVSSEVFMTWRFCGAISISGSKVCTSLATPICMKGNANAMLPPGITDPLGAKHGWEEIENRAAQLVSDQEKEQTGTCKCVCKCSLLDLVCFDHIAPVLLVFPICVHICVCSFIFHFNYGEDNSSVCANSTQTHTLLPSALRMVKSLYMSSVRIVHHVRFTPQWHFTCQLSVTPLFFLL